jgi:hypothetical protein
LNPYFARCQFGPDFKAFETSPVGGVFQALCIRWQHNISKRGYTMAKPNFNFVKRQKELEKKKKNEEKLQRKHAKNSIQPGENPDHSPDEGVAPE